jgi:hypothetical protein
MSREIDEDGREPSVLAGRAPVELPEVEEKVDEAETFGLSQGFHLPQQSLVRKG